MDIWQWWGQSDIVTRSTALVLCAMSVASWVVIFAKTSLLLRARQQIPYAVAAFWQSGDVQGAVARMAGFDRLRLVHPLVDAAQAVTLGVAASPTPPSLLTQGPREAQLTRALRDALHQSLVRLHWGEVVLATVGASAPFVGLLGTVWGIYHALSALATGGAVSLERLAGPVGEALVMTAAGLAVAIPAVLAYNLLSRWAAQIEADLEGFARDVRELFLALM